MKKLLYNLFIPVAVSLFLLTGCEIAGLKYQEDFNYDASIRDSKINMNALEFMKSRPDLFSSMIEAVKYANMEEEYTKPNRTFLLLTNRALSDETYAPSTPGSMGSYFASNKVANPNFDPNDPNNPDKGPATLTPDSWDVYPVEQVAQFLKYHIVPEYVSYSNAKAFPTFYKSLAYSEQNDTAFVSFHLTNDRNAYFYVNGYVGSRKTDLKPRTSGIDCTNGVIHVMDDYIVEPRKIDLGMQ